MHAKFEVRSFNRFGAITYKHLGISPQNLRRPLFEKFLRGHIGDKMFCGPFTHSFVINNVMTKVTLIFNNLCC